jgi:hypothetical protein
VGFRLSLLVKLANTRATGSSSTLADFIVRGLMEAQPALPTLEAELPSIRNPGLKTSLDELAAKLDAIRDAAREVLRAANTVTTPVVQLRLRCCEDGGEEQEQARELLRVNLLVDHFPEEMNAVGKATTRQLDRLAAELSRARTRYRDTMAYFGESDDAAAAAKVWAELEGFVRVHSAVAKTVFQERRLAAERKERSERHAKKTASAASAAAGAGSAIVATNIERLRRGSRRSPVGRAARSVAPSSSLSSSGWGRRAAYAAAAAIDQVVDDLVQDAAVMEQTPSL